MCGDDEALGEWPPLTNWPPSEHEPQPLKLSTCDLSTGDGGGRFCQGLVRLRAGQQTSYMYYVSRGSKVWREEGDIPFP